ncbi:uncharacterized protein [Amphiura filiformis]|uniref:uncharacterized protein n=1 Tax=Amphiura filiformis TaxID=82378 RepID=UPI003B20E142
MAAREVVEVLNRCESALETRNLDLSHCGLAYIAQAVYHIVKEVELATCNISNNDIKKIPVKFSREFPKITELNLSHNKIVSLPTEFNELSELVHADLSHNQLVEFPEGMYELANLKKLVLCSNNIVDIDVERLCNLQLEELDVTDNPLSSETWGKLEKVTTINVKMDPLKDNLNEMD